MGAERKSSKSTVFLGKRHDNKILNVQILLSRNFVVIVRSLGAFPCFMATLAQFVANRCSEASCGLVTFSLVL